MAKKLTAYRQKRDPAQTNEPFGAEPLDSSGAAESGGLIGAFVVHQHDASRMHYDLRLEMGGVLQSFAVPRGPSLDPKEKRLAVHTENHPIEYLDFEAVIPPGNYGAGAMIAWDRGTVRFLPPAPEEGLRTGKLDFVLSGYKLRGRFALVKVSGRKGQSEPAQTEWLLFKKGDAYSKEGGSVIDEQPRSVLSGLTVQELPDAQRIADEISAEAHAASDKKLTDDPNGWVPMLCGHGEEAQLARSGFVYELKLDGARALAIRDGDRVTLRYRSGRNTTESFPEVARALRALPSRSFVIDGEIVAFDDKGRPDFQRLGPRLHATRADEARRAAREIPVHYVAFDLLAIGDVDLRGLPLRERKRLLSRVLQGKGLVRPLDHLDDDARPLWALCQAHGLEGVIAKRGDSKYQVGPRRGSDWLKIKLDRDDDFVVVGWTRGEGNRGELGALDIASYVEDKLVSRGKVGSGLDDATIMLLREKLAAIEVDHPTVEGDLMPAPKGRTFVKPELVVSVRHAGFTREGHLRHPVFRGLRNDMTPEQCRAAPDEERVEAALQQADREHHRTVVASKDSGRVKLSNQDKVFWPDEGYTKGELCSYYARISDTMLTYLRGRPVLMVRYPDGITGKSFFQWNAPSHTPDWVRLFSLRSEEDDGRDVTAFLVDDLDTLLFMANLGSIPLHILASHADDLETSDFLTIDFDIGSAPFAHAIELARSLHDLLDEIGLRGFPKTSGQTGLHVLVALGGAPFMVAKTLAELFGRILNKKHPKISTMERVRSKRTPNTVYIDTGQTGRSRAIVAPYSVRATPGARVSTPLNWDEVGYGLDPSVFTMFTVPDRVEQHGDPMAELLTEKPNIMKAVEALAKLV